MIEQRIKEIGVRKSLGASIQSLVALLSKDFLKLVVVAIVIATPIAWYLMSNWLKDFAYRIQIQWWVFAVTGIGHCHRLANGKLSKHTGGIDEPGAELAKRVGFGFIVFCFST